MALLISRRNFGRLIILGVVGPLFGQSTTPPAEEPAITKAAEYEIKAAYLYNLAVFTRWPSSAFSNREAPLVVGVLGEDPFGPALDTVLATQRAQRRRITVVRAESGAAPPECHLLFVSPSERRRFAEILASVKSKPVLTVADTEPFGKLGGCVRLHREGRRVKLIANLGALREAGLRMDSELLRIATIVETEPQ